MILCCCQNTGNTMKNGSSSFLSHACLSNVLCSMTKRKIVLMATHLKVNCVSQSQNSFLLSIHV